MRSFAPVEVLGGAAALRRLDHQDQRPARLQAGLHIVNGLGALIEGNVLREAAAAGDDRRPPSAGTST